MARLHRNMQGKLAPCRATVGNCPYAPSEHFDNVQDYMDAMAKEQQGDRSPVDAARELLARERSLIAATRREELSFSLARKSIVARTEVFFNENGHESGNGVIVTRYRDNSAHVRLPLLRKTASGDWSNVQLQVEAGGTVRESFDDFLEGVEYVPPGTYRIVGSDHGEQIVTELSTEHYARLRAALTEASRIVNEPLPTAPTSSAQWLVDELKKRAS